MRTPNRLPKTFVEKYFELPTEIIKHCGRTLYWKTFLKKRQYKFLTNCNVTLLSHSFFKSGLPHRIKIFLIFDSIIVKIQDFMKFF